MSATTQFPDEHNPMPENSTAGLFESFDAPRTMPAGWDLSELMSPAKPSANGRFSGSEHTTIPVAEPPESGATQALESGDRHRFPQPNTYHSQWDLSG
ncbi:MAG: hypothetical protein A2W36_06050 [Chloroflexi bacterium RBG_16_58_14]|nr:MAG: hypothetical protein A2W36_06050 [Chloroflexi bacterium RBG_16_58_14]